MELLPEERATFLNSVAQKSQFQAKEVASLIKSHEQADDFLELPVVPRMSEVLNKLDLNFFAKDEMVGQFLILRELGKGSFSTVYLARQLSLNRDVALKVSQNLGQEAKTMASLEHDNIVRVFSETVHPEKNLRMICMQYVSGSTLEHLLAQFEKAYPSTGKTFIKAIDKLVDVPPVFDPSTLKDREYLRTLNTTEIVIWLGIQLSGALGFAHEKGVLHLDVKPGNILISPYGRPYLTDFNISLDLKDTSQKAPEMFGGTLHYMAPEHLNAFNAMNSEALRKIDSRADIYSLGVVLKEILAKLAPDEEAPGLKKILERCTAPEPSDRYQSTGELSSALMGKLEQSNIESLLPAPGPIARAATRWPVWALLVLTLLPQCLGSLFNIVYNSLRIVNEFSPEQQAFFKMLLPYWNLFIFSLGIILLTPALRPLFRFFRARRKKLSLENVEFKMLRKQILDYPLRLSLVVSICWGISTFFWPFTINTFAGPLSAAIVGHFFVSFFLSWLIALTYSFLYAQFIAVRVLYPILWEGCHSIRETARIELQDLPARFRLFHLLAGGTPLVAASLLILIGPESLATTAYYTYRAFAVSLIGLGLVGFLVSLRATHDLAETLFALTGKNA